MAVTASLTLTQTTGLCVGQVVGCNLNVANSGGSDVQISTIAPYFFLTANSSAPFPEKNPIARGRGLGVSLKNNNVPAGGSLNINFPVVFDAPSGDLSLSGAAVVPSSTWSVGCMVQTSDGSVVAASTATATVAPVQQAPGQFP